MKLILSILIALICLSAMAKCEQNNQLEANFELSSTYPKSWFEGNVTNYNINGFFGNMLDEIEYSLGNYNQCRAAIANYQVPDDEKQGATPTSIFYHFSQYIIKSCKLDTVPDKFLRNVNYILNYGITNFANLYVNQAHLKQSEIYCCLDNYFMIQNDALASGTQMGKCLYILIQDPIL